MFRTLCASLLLLLSASSASALPIPPRLVQTPPGRPGIVVPPRISPIDPTVAIPQSQQTVRLPNVRVTPSVLALQLWNLVDPKPQPLPKP